MEKQLHKIKEKHVNKEELMTLNKNELVDKIMQLEAQNIQLKNIISKSLSKDDKSGKVNKNNTFDFTKCNFRRVLLHIMYFGWDYQGLAVQEDSNQTIEHYLFHALIKSCLIEKRENSQYHRCGRTDKGVSSFGQVISISLRSKYSPEQQCLPSSMNDEITYCKIINRLLPKDIRVVGWMPSPPNRLDFSARFDCKKRLYKYYFPRSNLNIAAMRAACAHLIGSHDFRHLCKMDVGNGVTEFRREILNAVIEPVDEKDSEEPTSMYCLIIEGNAFLWHQIRCIMGVLLLIGQGKEKDDVIKELLDVDKYPRKPQYNMALDIPLSLYHCSYELDSDQEWIYDKDELQNLVRHLQGEWTIHNVKTTMIRDCLRQLEEEYKRLSANETENGESEGDSIMSHTECLLQGIKSKVYKPLLERETCSSLQERIDYYRKKRKLNNGNEATTELSQEMNI